MIAAGSALTFPLACASPKSGEVWAAVSFATLHNCGLFLSVRAATYRGLTPAERRPWWFVAGYLLLLDINGVTYGLVAKDQGMVPQTVTPLLTVSLGAKFLAVLVLLAGLLSFAARPLDRRARWKLALDVTTVIGGTSMALWYFVIGPALGNGASVSERNGLITLINPISELALIVGIGTVLLRGATSSARRLLPLLLAGAVGNFLADTFQAYYTARRPGGYQPVWDMLLAVAAYALVAIAAAERCRLAAEPPEAGTGPRPLRPHASLPYAALLLGFGLLVAAALKAGLYPWTGLVVGACVMTTAVAARQIVSLRENHALVMTDGLTGLANRRWLNDTLRRATERNRRVGASFAVLAIDLDGFKQVNDTLGHDAGDTLLVTFADVLRRHTRPTDLSVRLGGDEFAVLLDGVGEAGAIAVADRIVAAVRDPVPIGGQCVRIRASIGIAVANPVDERPDLRELLHHADVAMYAAKREHTGGWRLYSAESLEADRNAAALREDLMRAAAEEQLRVLYQPIVALTTGALVAVEALVRWHHPVRGEVSPAEFIPVAEEIGVINEIGAWVLEHACRQVRVWQDRLGPGQELYLSVNFSAHQLHRPDLAAEVLDTLRRTGLDPRHLVLEITEGALVDDRSAVPQLRELREHGVRVALDDFGTGYSSLRYLTRFPVDILKLDRCFVAELNGDPEGSAVAEAVIRLGQLLHLDTVAEGIEHPEQATELTLLGCRTAQGYHFARPLPPEALGELIDGAGTKLPYLPVDLPSRL